MGAEGVGGTGQRAVGASRAVGFWNLVVHFREHCLPVTFLLADASTGEGPGTDSRILCGSCSGTHALEG